MDPKTEISAERLNVLMILSLIDALHDAKSTASEAGSTAHAAVSRTAQIERAIVSKPRVALQTRHAPK